MSPLFSILFISIYIFQGVAVGDPSAPFILLKKKKKVRQNIYYYIRLLKYDEQYQPFKILLTGMTV